MNPLIKGHSPFHGCKTQWQWPYAAHSAEGKELIESRHNAKKRSEAPLPGAPNQQTGEEGAARSGEPASCPDHLSTRNHPSGMPSPSDAHFQHLLLQLCQGKRIGENSHIPPCRTRTLWSTSSCWPTCASIASNRSASNASWWTIAQTCTLTAFCEERHF